MPFLKIFLRGGLTVSLCHIIMKITVKMQQKNGGSEMNTKTKRAWLKEIRKKCGYSQEVTAKEAGIHRSSYTHIENGSRNPSVATAQRLARVLGFDWTIFFSPISGELQQEAKGRKQKAAKGGK